MRDHSRRGLASKLLQYAENRSRRANSQKIDIDAAQSGLDFGKHHGFVLDREIDRETRGGLSIKALKMHKRL